MLKALCVIAFLVAVGGMLYKLLTYEEPGHGHEEDPRDRDPE